MVSEKASCLDSVIENAKTQIKQHMRKAKTKEQYEKTKLSKCFLTRGCPQSIADAMAESVLASRKDPDKLNAREAA